MKKFLITFCFFFAVSIVSASAQSFVVWGKVNDEYTDPLIGASMMVKGTTAGTITDLDGNFVLIVPYGAILQISYVGCSSVEMPIDVSNCWIMLSCHQIFWNDQLQRQEEEEEKEKKVL